MAYPPFDPSKHARGFHGRFARSGAGVAVQRFRLGAVARMRSDRGGENGIVENLAAGIRSPSAFQPRTPAGRHREAKKRVQIGTEVARGVRQPRNFAEKESLNWTSPRKRAEQMALTGNVRRPRRDAIQAAKTAALGFGGLQPANTVGVQRTFTGKTRRVRAITPPTGVRPTVRGAANLAKYEPDDARVRSRAKLASQPAVDVQQELKGIRGRRKLEAYARQRGVTFSALDTDTAIRQKILKTI